MKGGSRLGDFRFLDEDSRVAVEVVANDLARGMGEMCINHQGEYEHLGFCIHDCTMMFNAKMELWTNLQEDSTLQKLKTNVRETQRRYDEVQATVCTFVPAQCLMKLQEGKQLQSHMEELQRKEALLKAIL